MTDSEFLERCKALEGDVQDTAPPSKCFGRTVDLPIYACLWREHLRRWLGRQNIKLVYWPDGVVRWETCRLMPPQTLEEATEPIIGNHHPNENAALVAAFDRVQDDKDKDDAKDTD